jgi:hypothetical protein
MQQFIEEIQKCGYRKKPNRLNQFSTKIESTNSFKEWKTPHIVEWLSLIYFLKKPLSFYFEDFFIDEKLEGKDFANITLGTLENCFADDVCKKVLLQEIQFLINKQRSYTFI